MDTNTLLIIVSIGTTIGSLAWWLAVQFKEIRKEIQQQGEKLLEKLEYHERHDDKRFSDIVNSLWELRLRNAAMEGITPPIRAPKAKEDH